MQDKGIKKIGFFGYEYTDIAWYLARMYTHAGGQVVMVDMTGSRREMASLSILKYEELPEEMVKKGVRVIKGQLFREEDLEGVGCIIYCFDYDWCGVNATDMSEIVLVTDMMQRNASLLSRLNISEYENVQVIVRNAIYLKYSTKTLVELTGAKYDEEKVFELTFDEADYKNRCYMCVDRNDKLEKLSPLMRDLLVRCYNAFFGEVGKKTMKEILRKA